MADETILQKTFDLGICLGIQMMMDKIEVNGKKNKPVMANGELYFLKDSKQHLYDVMEEIDKQYEH